MTLLATMFSDLLGQFRVTIALFLIFSNAYVDSRPCHFTRAVESILSGVEITTSNHVYSSKQCAATCAKTFACKVAEYNSGNTTCSLYSDVTLTSGTGATNKDVFILTPKNCPSGFVSNGNSPCIHINCKGDRATAVAYCTSLGSKLLSITTQLEHDHLKTEALKKWSGVYLLPKFMILTWGTVDENNVLSWGSGKNVGYTNWASGQPSGGPGCVTIISGFYWTVTHYSQCLACFVCEIE